MPLSKESFEDAYLVSSMMGASLYYCSKILKKLHILKSRFEFAHKTMFNPKGVDVYDLIKWVRANSNEDIFNAIKYYAFLPPLLFYDYYNNQPPRLISALANFEHNLSLVVGDHAKLNQELFDSLGLLHNEMCVFAGTFQGSLILSMNYSAVLFTDNGKAVIKISDIIRDFETIYKQACNGKNVSFYDHEFRADLKSPQSLKVATEIEGNWKSSPSVTKTLPELVSEVYVKYKLPQIALDNLQSSLKENDLLLRELIWAEGGRTLASYYLAYLVYKNDLVLNKYLAKVDITSDLQELQDLFKISLDLKEVKDLANMMKLLPDELKISNIEQFSQFAEDQKQFLKIVSNYKKQPESEDAQVDIVDQFEKIKLAIAQCVSKLTELGVAAGVDLFPQVQDEPIVDEATKAQFENYAQSLIPEIVSKLDALNSAD